MKILGVIPARYASTRFPGKPLADIGGKSMIQRVYEQAEQAADLDEVLVATDDARIFRHVQKFGGEAVMTSPDCNSGTERIVEVARSYPECGAFVNIQGDEPFIDPVQIDQVCGLLATTGPRIATLLRPMQDLGLLHNPNVVKVVRAADGRAMYFSRSPIPYLRNESPEDWSKANSFYQHIGIYGYTAEAIAAIAEMPPSVYEAAESLEQLRWLEHGLPIYTALTTVETLAVDTPEDLERIRQHLGLR